MKINELKSILRKMVAEALTAPAPAKPKPTTKPGTPTKPAPMRRPLTPPTPAPKTPPKAKALKEQESAMMSKIVKRFQKLKK